MAENDELGHNELDNKALGGLIKLQSKDHEQILDVVDQLRSEGISKYVNLPQLIVCGDQSSGKSSVLEAISGLSFPTRDNVCTRFATELILRRAPESSVTASIYPDDERLSIEKERLRNFRSPTLALDRFGEIVEKAEAAMGVKRDGLSFSKDVLRVEVLGPTQPHLTLVDLPGLYHAPDESQNEEGVAFVESMVLSYMKNSRSVMLAVISAKSEIALQKVTSFTRKLDPEGERTMGIITKPDTIPNGSEMEKSFYKLAQNERMPFRLGWHVLKNRTFEERHCSLTQRNESEIAFLSQGVWASLPRTHVGIGSLRHRLSVVLKDHILSQMPSFIAEAQSLLKAAEAGLQRLGEPRRTSSEQRQYLLRGSERFSRIVSAAVDGMYSDPFFGDAMTDDGYHKRIRAIIQNRLSDFSNAMRDKGEQRNIVDDDVGARRGTADVTRSDFIQEVRERVRRSRGREVPGTFSPLIIGDLFFIHARSWQMVVDEFMEVILNDTRTALVHMLQEALDIRSVERMLQHVINPRLVVIESGLREKTAELLIPHQSGHPITYNHYFVATIQETRKQHHCKSVTQKLQEFFGDSYLSTPTTQIKATFNMDALINALATQQSHDTEQFACSEAIDCMLAYYKIARLQFVDDFSSLAIERSLLIPLLTLCDPSTVLRLKDDVVEEIAKEDDSATMERDRLGEKVRVLSGCLKKLYQLDLHGLKVAAMPEPNDVADSNSEVSLLDEPTADSDPALETPDTLEATDAHVAAKDVANLDWLPERAASKQRKRHAKAALYEYD